MKKIYKSLTADQIKRGVIFSSTLSAAKTEQQKDTIHEVYDGEINADISIENLKNDSFFNYNPCGWKYNIIRS